MNNTECTTRTPESAGTDDDDRAFEEPEDACLRRELDVRPIAYLEPEPGEHPDGRPCPKWCWIAHNPRYAHEIHPEQPMDASHKMEPHPSVVASLYPGLPASGRGDDRYVQTATLEPRLSQFGQREPVIKVAFRRYEGREQVFDDSYLRLTITDASELITALEYLIMAADRG